MGYQYLRMPPPDPFLLLSPRETIGVDLGGTKMAVGVVDSEQHIHYEGKESSIGLSEDELVEDLGRELEEAKEARPDVLCAGLGIPATIDHDRGVAIQAVNLEISDVPAARPDARSGSACPSTSTTTPTSRPSPSSSSGRAAGRATW